ncbi:protein Bouncer-like [Micropterus dolomieu]|uniref:protein Bouncer-like n=1 Tax=Micropterus dolomieu TaxID=147949 RepID=UPI001E8CC0B7|nr:protein Bouncer-like [Micropterus dolomieu]
MNKFLWSCAALLTLFVTVESLTCNTCSLNILGYCFEDAPVNCTKNQTMCYSGVAKFSADLPDIYSRDCIEPSACKNDTGSILNVKYTITRKCCHTDLCNRATAIQLPLTAALGAALVAVWSQWGL